MIKNIGLCALAKGQAKEVWVLMTRKELRGALAACDTHSSFPETGVVRLTFSSLSDPIGNCVAVSESTKDLNRTDITDYDAS